MGKITGFMEYQRETASYRPVEERIHDYLEVPLPFSEDKLKSRARVAWSAELLSVIPAARWGT